MISRLGERPRLVLEAKVAAYYSLGVSEAGNRRAML